MGQSDLEIGYFSILNGEAAKILKDAKERYANLKAKADALETKIRETTDLQIRSSAWQSLEKANAELEKLKTLVNQAIERYNSAASEISAWSVGMFSPESVSGLSALPLAGVVLALIAAGIGVAAVYAFSDLVRAVRGQEVTTKGFIGQTADLVGQSKGLLEETRKWVPILFGLGALGAGIYFLSKKRRGSGGGGGEKAFEAAPVVSLAKGAAV